MSKQAKLLNFIKSGPNCTRRWKECREFYRDLYSLECYTRAQSNRDVGRAMDYALYRLERAGMTKNISRGLHQAA